MEAQDVIRLLNLAPHPEGGYYRETYRASSMVPGRGGAPRAASTSIYFLLPAGTFSAFHRVAADEVWNYYAGDSLELVTVQAPPQKQGTRTVLGSNLGLGERPQYVVPAGVYQAARPLGHRYTLCGCTVSPGFDFADFELPSKAALADAFPGAGAELRGWLAALSR